MWTLDFTLSWEIKLVKILYHFEVTSSAFLVAVNQMH